MDELIDQIMHEGDFHPSEEVVRQLLALGEEVHFGPKKAVIEFGHINRNVYIVKEEDSAGGLLREGEGGDLRIRLSGDDSAFAPLVI